MNLSLAAIDDLYCYLRMGAGREGGRPTRRYILPGAVGTLCETMGVDVPSPTWRALNERNLADAREQLDAETFDAAWMEGRAITLDKELAGRT